MQFLQMLTSIRTILTHTDSSTHKRWPEGCGSREICAWCPTDNWFRHHKIKWFSLTMTNGAVPLAVKGQHPRPTWSPCPSKFSCLVLLFSCLGPTARKIWQHEQLIQACICKMMQDIISDTKCIRKNINIKICKIVNTNYLHEFSPSE